MKNPISSSVEWWDKYNAYLQSPEWKSKRARVLKRASGICEGCGIKRATQVHHLHYKNVFKEFLFELVAICEECHDMVHGKTKEDLLKFDPIEWMDGFPCESCRWQDEENNRRWCGKFHIHARIALSDGGSCGPFHKELEPLK